MLRKSKRKERNGASLGASVGASLGSRGGPVGAGIGAGFGAAAGYIAGALAPDCGCGKKLLPDGGEPRDGRPGDRRADERVDVAIPVEEE